MAAICVYNEEPVPVYNTSGAVIFYTIYYYLFLLKTNNSKFLPPLPSQENTYIRIMNDLATRSFFYYYLFYYCILISILQELINYEFKEEGAEEEGSRKELKSAQQEYNARIILKCVIQLELIQVGRS